MRVNHYMVVAQAGTSFLEYLGCTFYESNSIVGIKKSRNLGVWLDWSFCFSTNNFVSVFSRLVHYRKNRLSCGGFCYAANINYNRCFVSFYILKN